MKRKQDGLLCMICFRVRNRYPIRTAHVVSVLIRVKGGVLLQLRDNNTTSFPLRWGFFGGSLEKGEKPREAGLREVREELGIIIPRLRRISSGLLGGTRNTHGAIYQTKLSACRRYSIAEGLDFRVVRPREFVNGPIRSNQMRRRYPLVPLPFLGKLIRLWS